MSNNSITVFIKYGEMEQTFVGKVNDVWVNVNRFFSEMIPTFEVVRRVVLTIDLESLINDCEQIIAFTMDRPCVLIPKKRLTDNETLMVHLLAVHVGEKLGLPFVSSLTLGELQAELGKSAKIASTRLSELCRDRLVRKTEDNRYAITALGIRKLQEELIPKIRKRIKV